MDTTEILTALKEQRDRLSNAITTLQGHSGGKRKRGRPPISKPHTLVPAERRSRRRLSVAARKKISVAAKARWAKAKRAGKNSL